MIGKTPNLENRATVFPIITYCYYRLLKLNLIKKLKITPLAQLTQINSIQK